MRVAAAWRIVVGQAVDQADVRVALKNSSHVNDRDAFDGERGNNFKSAQQRLDIVLHPGLNGADHNILTALLAASSFVKHAEGFADPRGVAQKDFEASAGGGDV